MRNQISENEMKIDTKSLEAEYHELTKATNAWFHHYSIDTKWRKELENMQENDLRQEIRRQTESIGESIVFLKDPRSSSHSLQHGRAYKDVMAQLQKTRPNFRMARSSVDYCSTLIRRMVAIRLLVDSYGTLTPQKVNESTSKLEASKWFRRYVETNTGWRNSINFDTGPGGDLIEYSEETETMYGNHQRVKWKATIGIEGSWMDDVLANKIPVVDIAGKMYLTCAAKEIEEHELKDDGIRLFNAKLMSTKVTRDMNSWQPKAGDGKNIIQLENRVIAVQTLESGERPVITTGKNQSWAIRTMKGRMKKKMLQMMDI